jgi:hypothetical protein
MTVSANNGDRRRAPTKPIVGGRRLDDIAEADGFVDLQYLAERWMVGVWCVRKFIKDGTLPAIKIGRGLRIRAVDAKSYEVRTKLLSSSS